MLSKKNFIALHLIDMRTMFALSLKSFTCILQSCCFNFLCLCCIPSTVYCFKLLFLCSYLLNLLYKFSVIQNIKMLHYTCAITFFFVTFLLIPTCACHLISSLRVVYIWGQIWQKEQRWLLAQIAYVYHKLTLTWLWLYKNWVFLFFFFISRRTSCHIPTLGIGQSCGLSFFH